MCHPMLWPTAEWGSSSKTIRARGSCSRWAPSCASMRRRCAARRFRNEDQYLLYFKLKPLARGSCSRGRPSRASVSRRRCKAALQCSDNRFQEPDTLNLRTTSHPRQLQQLEAELRERVSPLLCHL